jgi:hypothetical protein
MNDIFIGNMYTILVIGLIYLLYRLYLCYVDYIRLCKYRSTIKDISKLLVITLGITGIIETKKLYDNLDSFIKFIKDQWFQ